MNTFHSLAFESARREIIQMAELRGKVALIVNTATRCGLAGQFAELEALHELYKDRGLVVIGFPCDQFAGQEPETDDTVVGVCKENFGVTFMLGRKVDVNGANAHPVFTYLKDNSPSPLGKAIKWNFTKFLVSRDGETVKRYAPTTSPKSMQKDIEKLLNSDK